MNESLKKLRDAVTGRDREVEVTADGAIREINESAGDDAKSEAGKPTKLAPRTFGA